MIAATWVCLVLWLFIAAVLILPLPWQAKVAVIAFIFPLGLIMLDMCIDLWRDRR